MRTAPSRVRRVRPRRRWLPIVATLGVTGVAVPAAGQSAGYEPASIELPRGARALALGARPVGTEDPDLFLAHPALARRGGGGVHLGIARYGRGGTGLSVATTRSWFGGSVSIGVGLETLEYRGTEPGTRAGGVSPLFGAGGVGVSEQAAVLAVAGELLGLDVGVTARGVSLRFDASRRTTATIDAGIAHDLGPLTAAVSVRGLGRDVEVAGREVSPPTELLVGVGADGARVGPFDLGFAAEAGRRADDEWVGGGGLELSWWPIVGRTFTLRAGARHAPETEEGPWSIGGSYRGDSLVLAWGWRPVDGTDGVHTVTLGWR